MNLRNYIRLINIPFLLRNYNCKIRLLQFMKPSLYLSSITIAFERSS